MIFQLFIECIDLKKKPLNYIFHILLLNGKSVRLVSIFFYYSHSDVRLLLSKIKYEIFNQSSSYFIINKEKKIFF